jgi:hypothetical protein
MENGFASGTATTIMLRTPSKKKLYNKIKALESSGAFFMLSKTNHFFSIKSTLPELTKQLSSNYLYINS